MGWGAVGLSLGSGRVSLYQKFALITAGAGAGAATKSTQLG